MATTNDITGDAIRSKASSKTYAENYDRIFKPKDTNSNEEPVMTTQMEMPKYVCHKKVHALQIKKVYLHSTHAVLEVEQPYAFISVSLEWVEKHKPEAGGYYVVYKDGYKSYSPQEAFESGYTKL